MKLSKIKSVCRAERMVLMVEPMRAVEDGKACNTISQWIGTRSAMYAADLGATVDLGVLANIWELTDKQQDAMTWSHEAPEEWEWLARLPGMMSKDAPVIGVAELGTAAFFRTPDGKAACVCMELMEPVIKQEGIHSYTVQRMPGGKLWLLCYVDESLCAAICCNTDWMRAKAAMSRARELVEMQGTW